MACPGSPSHPAMPIQVARLPGACSATCISSRITDTLFSCVLSLLLAIWKWLPVCSLSGVSLRAARKPLHRLQGHAGSAGLGATSSAILGSCAVERANAYMDCRGCRMCMAGANCQESSAILSNCAAVQANFHTDCRGMQAQLLGLSSLMSILDPQLTSFLVSTIQHATP